ncbi:hypothetical protein ABW21_db0209503 [Orbilia brochopaga]|nr:hypothetical protein ABW21_db0209503 [Drechslerella brochopaga]
MDRKTELLNAALPPGFQDDTNAATAEATLKVPPPEARETIHTRSWVIASFWIVAIFLGLPLWHATTTIYRAPLPMQEMQDWSEGKLCKTEFPLLVEVEAPSFPDAESLLKTVQHSLDDANDFAAHKPHHLRLRLAAKKAKSATEDPKSDNDENVACLLRLLPDSRNGFNHTVHSSSRTVDIHYPPPSSSSQSSISAGLAKFVAEILELLFWQEQELIEHLLLPQTSNPGSLNAPSSQTVDDSRDKKTPPARPRALTADINRRMSRVVKYSPSYHLTFSLFTATSIPASWDIESAISQYLTPLLSALSSISNFTISTQVQYYASISSSVTPTFDEELHGWTLKKEDLSSFINSAEWPLASISNDPNLNFILYIPHPSITPLLIPSALHSDSFLLPQWGGVTILNLDQNPAAHLSLATLKPTMETFATHLLALLGAPPHPASLPIRLDSLTRQRSAEVLVSASSTLGSLQRLVNALPSISIPTTVSTSVKDSIRHLSLACEELRKGSFVKALEMGRVAQEEAEKAFFERTMVAQVYFPDEHKLAVYLPLLGPVSVPLVLGVIREVKRIFAERRARAAAVS